MPQVKNVPTGAVVTSINGKQVVGRCGACSWYITEDSTYDIDEEGGDMSPPLSEKGGEEMKDLEVTIERAQTVQLKPYTPCTVRIQISGHVEDLDDMTQLADAYVDEQISKAVTDGIERYGIR